MRSVVHGPGLAPGVGEAAPLWTPGQPSEEPAHSQSLS